MIDPATLRIRYPAMAAVTDEVASYWLTDAARTVTEAWGEDQEPATLALAAHRVATTPGALPASASALPAGVTSFRSGAFSATISDAAAAAQVKGGYDATVYGQEFAVYLRRYGGGPMLIGPVECVDPCW
jgi:hypothetical protein